LHLTIASNQLCDLCVLRDKNPMPERSLRRAPERGSAASWAVTKTTKTFVCSHMHHCAGMAERAAPIDKSSLVLSFKKERLAFPPCHTRPQAR
jgi:hypothetical protein